MPTPERVKALITMVQAGHYVDAIQRFYTKDATMQENMLPARQGIDTLMAHEEAALKRCKEIRTLPVKEFLISGDRVVINWVFQITGIDGRTYQQNEIAWQRWVGDRIAEERFYYDPAQQRVEERRKAPRKPGPR